MVASETLTVVAGSVVIPLLAAVVAFAVARRQTAGLDLEAARQILYAEYRDGEFRDHKPVTIGGKRCLTVKDAARVALHIRDRDPIAWEKSTLEPDTPSRKVAGEVALRLQRLGSTALLGLVPLRLVLAEVADQVIDDWLISRRWIFNYQDKEGFVRKGTSGEGRPVFYHRRHAEAIALACCIWLDREFENPRTGEMIELEGGLGQTKRRLRTLISAERTLTPTAVRMAVRRAAS